MHNQGNKWKNGLIICLIISMMLSLAACSKAGGKESVIWHVTDLHYLSSVLVEDQDFFLEVMANADGKVTQYVSELYAAFEAKALKEMPEAIVISGDLTLNGSPESHKELAARLMNLKNAGIAVLVVPGNHDIARTAYKFTAEGVDYAPGTDGETFKEIYQDLGYNDAISKDENSFSYVYELSNGTRLLMLDVNTDVKGSVQKGTLEWIKKVLQKAKWTGHPVISVTHQNLLVHVPQFVFGYVINNNNELIELYEKYNVQLNLSGHMHTQNIVQEGNIYDIAGSSVSVCPNQFGVLKLEKSGAIDYHTERVDVSSWAKENGITNPDLLEFEQFSSDFFDQSNSGRLRESMQDYEGDNVDLLIDTIVRMNRQSFEGHVQPLDEEVLEQLTHDSFFGRYMQTLIAQMGVDHTKLRIE